MADQLEALELEILQSEMELIKHLSTYYQVVWTKLLIINSSVKNNVCKKAIYGRLRALRVGVVLEIVECMYASVEKRLFTACGLPIVTLLFAMYTNCLLKAFHIRNAVGFLDFFLVQRFYNLQYYSGLTSSCHFSKSEKRHWEIFLRCEHAQIAVLLLKWQELGKLLYFVVARGTCHNQEKVVRGEGILATTDRCTFLLL